MKHIEKKLRVDSFVSVKKKLAELGAKKVNHAVESHYYAQTNDNNVTKLVQYDTKSEIHLLSETNGTFALTESIPTKDAEAGLKWLRDKGHTKTTTVKMDYDEYAYKDGIVGLYLINDSLHSIILDFPPEKYKAIEKDLGLEKAEVITVPYNKYLE